MSENPLPKHARDNRSRQLNEQDPTFYQSQGAPRDEAAREAAKITQANQEGAEESDNQNE